MESFNKYFYYKGNSFYCEDVNLANIAEKYGTPFYVYSKTAIEEKINEYKEAFQDYPTLICYATKANSNLSILKIVEKNDLGVDIVSGGELFKAKKAGISSNKIVYAGVGKTDFELSYAVREQILSFNVESLEELEVLNGIAKSQKKKARVSIRVNPDVNPKTHPYISTGLRTSKFGIDIDEAINAYRLASKLENLEIVGIHCHIGSQIMDINPYIESVEKVADLIFKLKKEGIELQHFDIGGGLGIKYRLEDNPPKPKELAKAILPIVSSTGLKLILEPGRSLIGEAGALISQVIFTKKKKNKHFIIVDSGMNDLLRPAMYNAYHHIYGFPKKEEKIVADIVGPICETGDFLALDRKIDNLKRGDYIAVMSAGAYGSSMSSNYNVRPRAAEILVEDDKFEIIRDREDYNYLIQPEEKYILEGDVKK
ncbi:MAG: diaminopimelate decarboxylase [Aquificota bacterium]|nr:MAG: diaminopimelate decarboxylase [Aquificota bacterium]